MKDGSESKISLVPYKGVRDFYPEDERIQKHIFGAMRRASESFGYEEYNASILESTELYMAKTSEEIVNEQTYTFTDRGDRSVTLRPEMTPTVARMVASRKRELGFPLRWYSIVNNFRYERPQKGRLREFWQLNVDMFGVEGIEAEIEAITIAYKIMRSLKAQETDFELRVNDRNSVNSFLNSLNLDEDKKYKITKIFDKKNKITKPEFEDQIKETLGDGAKEFFNKLKELEVCPEKVSKLIEELKKNNIVNIKFDPFLMRGLDYYTGIVFEVFDTDPENNRSMFGGGRYDNLLDIFGEEKIPAFGFGMGDVTAFEFLKSRNLLPEYKPETDLYLCIIDEKFKGFTDELAQTLRDEKINVAVDYSYKKIGDQIKKANKKKSRSLQKSWPNFSLRS